MPEFAALRDCLVQRLDELIEATQQLPEASQNHVFLRIDEAVRRLDTLRGMVNRVIEEQRRGPVDALDG